MFYHCSIHIFLFHFLTFKETCIYSSQKHDFLKKLRICCGLFSRYFPSFGRVIKLVSLFCCNFNYRHSKHIFRDVNNENKLKTHRDKGFRRRTNSNKKKSKSRVVTAHARNIFLPFLYYDTLDFAIFIVLMIQIDYFLRSGHLTS